MQHQVGLHQCVGLGDLRREAAMSTWLQCQGMQQTGGAASACAGNLQSRAAMSSVVAL